MATQWTPADLPSLVMMARLYDDVISGESRKAAADFRQLADRFGLSPLARRRNYWLLADGEVGQDAEQADATVIRLRPSG